MQPIRRIHVGKVPVDGITLKGAVDAIDRLVEAGRGGSVFTPNVDHVVLADQDDRFRRAYEIASLSLADGMPIVWASRLLGHPLPEKVSGSDLLVPLCGRAALRGWRVYLLGARPPVGLLAAHELRARFPQLDIVGVRAPRIDESMSAHARAVLLRSIRAARPDLVFVALGAPKQELWIQEAAPHLRPAILLGVGATLDFVAGTTRRAPAWVSDHGLEWLYRLSREPRRLWRRYLLRDPRFFWILLRSLRAARRDLDGSARDARVAS